MNKENHIGVDKSPKNVEKCLNLKPLKSQLNQLWLGYFDPVNGFTDCCFSLNDQKPYIGNI